MPQPITITVSASVTCPRATAWKPTLIGSMRAASRSAMPSAGMIFCQGRAMYSRMAPSRCTPSVSLFSQALNRPARQDAQCPQWV